MKTTRARCLQDSQLGPLPDSASRSWHRRNSKCCQHSCSALLHTTATGQCAEYINLLSPVVAICTTLFNTLKLCILPIACTCVFHMVLTINSGCFPKQH
jgi:hypothetical protein